MKSGTRSTGESRYTAAAARTTLAVLGSTGSAISRVMRRVRSGSVRSKAFTPESSQALGDQFADVTRRQRLLGTGHLAPQIQHGQAERARRRHHVGPDRVDLFDTDHVDSLFRRNLHPHVTAATAAAEPARPVAGSLDQPKAGHGASGRPGRF